MLLHKANWNNYTVYMQFTLLFPFWRGTEAPKAAFLAREKRRRSPRRHFPSLANGGILPPF